MLFNMLSRLVITFPPRSKRLLISWLQSPPAVILEPKKIKSGSVSIVSPSICHEVMGSDAMIFVFWTLSFKPTFSHSSFSLIKRLFSSSSLSATRVVSSAYLRLLIFLFCLSHNTATQVVGFHLGFALWYICVLEDTNLFLLTPVSLYTVTQVDCSIPVHCLYSFEGLLHTVVQGVYCIHTCVHNPRSHCSYSCLSYYDNVLADDSKAFCSIKTIFCQREAMCSVFRSSGFREEPLFIIHTKVAYRLVVIPHLRSVPAQMWRRVAHPVQ